MLEVQDFVEGARRLRPDIVVGLGDVLFGARPGVKRKGAMGERTEGWVELLVRGLESSSSSSSSEAEERDGTSRRPAIFAPILPIEREPQSWYLNALRDELREKIRGLALYEIGSLEAVPEGLGSLAEIVCGGDGGAA